jgi:hypothetical protein
MESWNTENPDYSKVPKMKAQLDGNDLINIRIKNSQQRKFESIFYRKLGQCIIGGTVIFGIASIFIDLKLGKIPHVLDIFTIIFLLAYLVFSLIHEKKKSSQK